MKNSDFDKLYDLLYELYLLTKNNGKHYITQLAFVRGVEGLLGILCDESCSIEQRLLEVKQDYKGLVACRPCTFMDSGIWHEDEATRISLNKKLDSITYEISNLLFPPSSYPSVEEGYPPGHPYWSIPGIKDK